ncbi:hypothetical protein HKBW3S25_00143 [Candidatus Hakubella thermalkaliphila]|uniref:Uncharacterized protein n=1 Tax=Candidatus Hakubella thermalkaliphila TaxID=2754717 RepID=A0A6V8P1Q6_9ACTN|nr:hypothetical protein HKBW3S25_00143 [Candidatus Hakubella thermalkaliphila]
MITRIEHDLSMFVGLDEDALLAKLQKGRAFIGERGML